jgi:long-chain acyl-CoA synthetase
MRLIRTATSAVGESFAARVHGVCKAFMGLEQLLLQSAQRAPEKAAVVCGSARYSYRQLEEQSNRLAHRLMDSGVQLGDRVAICLENSLNTIVSIFAVLKTGGVIVVVNPQTRQEYLTSVLGDSEPAALIARGSQIAALRGSWPALAAMKAVLAADEGLVPSDAPVTAPATRHSEADLAALVYTSGSTGGAKGVMLSHRNMMAAAASICSYLELTPADVILNVLPLAFTYGLGQITTAVHAGATVVLERSFAYPRAVIDTMQREHVTGFPLVPTIATLLLQQDLLKHHFPNLRYITSAAAALPVDKIQRLRAAFPGVKVYSMYGQTECQRACYLPHDQLDSRPLSVGIPIPGSEAFVIDEQGHPALRCEVGELVVRGPHIMRGYWRQPDATVKALRQSRGGETELHTGDLFTTDEEGFLYFVGRKDDMINTRGEKVAPREVEEVIAKLPGVADVVVYGIPDDVLGEAVAAAVTLSPLASLSSARVQRFCLEHLDSFKVPKVVEIRDVLPTTPTGKVSRRTLRAAEDRPGEVCA